MQRHPGLHGFSRTCAHENGEQARQRASMLKLAWARSHTCNNNPRLPHLRQAVFWRKINSMLSMPLVGALAEKILGFVEPVFLAGAVFFAALFQRFIQLFEQFALMLGELYGRLHLHVAIQVAHAG